MNFKLDQIRFDLIDKYNQLSKTNEIITAKTIVDFYKNKMSVLNSIVSVFKKHNNDMVLPALTYANSSNTPDPKVACAQRRKSTMP